MIFVDNSVWIDLFNGRQTIQKEVLVTLLGNKPVAIGNLVLTEAVQGFKHDKDYRTAKEYLAALTLFELSGRALAIKSADNFRLLRKQGITVRKTIDVLIATFCIENNLPLLHSDKEFEPFHQHLNLLNALEFTIH